MRKGCKTINLGDVTMIMCGGEPTDHKCNENATCYDTTTGERIIFNDNNAANKWYEDNYENVNGGSVACSICGRAVIDNAMWL